jgi:hypothetical protein
MSAYPSEFDHFASIDEEQKQIAEATLADVRTRMTDEAVVALHKAGIVQATADKESAARIVAGCLTVAKFAGKLLGLGI